MHDLLPDLFSSSGFMPHGHCYLWQPGVVWLHVLSDGIIAASYLSIPLTLSYFVRRRRDVPFRLAFVAFGIFIVSCGFTHMLEIWTLWTPTYWLSGSVKAITATSSAWTAVLLVRLMPQALEIPSPQLLREARDLLAVGEARFRAATEGMNDAFFILDATHTGDEVQDLRFVEVNAVGALDLGAPRERIVGSLLSEAKSPSAIAGQLAELVRVFREQSAYDAGIDVRSSDGQMRSFHLRAVPLSNGVAVTVANITERRRSERDRELHSAVVKNMSEGLCLFGAKDRVIVYTNPKFDRMLGYDANELAGRPAAYVIHDDSPGEVARVDRLLDRLRADSEAPYEVRTTRKDGRRITCSGNASIIVDESRGELVVAVQGDITEQKRVEEERDGFFRLSLDKLCIAGFDGYFKRLNPAWEASLGWSMDELMARPWIERVHPDDSERTREEWRRAIADTTAVEVENRYRCKDGSYRTLAWRAVPSRGHEIIYASVRDVTAARQTEAALKTSVAEKEVLLQEVHHRVKNNLQVVSSLLKLQAQRMDEPVAKHAFGESQARVRSIALLHETLYQSHDLAALRFGTYADNLVHALLRTHGANAPAKCLVSASDIVLPMEQAVACGLILNELVTNSLKHAT